MQSIEKGHAAASVTCAVVFASLHEELLKAAQTLSDPQKNCALIDGSLFKIPSGILARDFEIEGILSREDDFSSRDLFARSPARFRVQSRWWETYFSVLNPEFVKHAGERDILLMRGQRWFQGRGLVHRYPPIEKSGLKRLYVCCDIID